MLKVRSINKSFGDHVVLSDVSFDLPKGQVVGLIGPSGGGKSVLLKIISKVLEPDSGSVEFTDSKGNIFQPKAGFLFQEGALFDSMSVIENVAFPLLNEQHKNSGCLREDAYNKAYEILKEVGLSEAYEKHVGQLSGGMRRRVGIARALVNKPELVLLDDPTGGLDPVAASVIIKLVLNLHAQYHPTVVIVSHDLRRLIPNVQQIFALFDGKLCGSYQVSELLHSASPDVISFIKTRYDFS